MTKRTTITITHRFILPFVIDNFYRPNEAWAPNISETLMPEVIWLENTKQKKDEVVMYNNLPFLVKDWDDQQGQKLQMQQY